MLVGDTVTRQMGGMGVGPTMSLIITAISPMLITCGPYTFDATTGAEIDAELGWDAYHSGSFLMEIVNSWQRRPLRS